MTARQVAERIVDGLDQFVPACSQCSAATPIIMLTAGDSSVVHRRGRWLRVDKATDTITAAIADRDEVLADVRALLGECRAGTHWFAWMEKRNAMLSRIDALLSPAGGAAGGKGNG